MSLRSTVHEHYSKWAFFFVSRRRIRTITKVAIARIDSGYRSSNALNNDFEVIEDAFDNTLSRDGTGPNEMLANIDLNGYRVINASAAVNPTDLVRLAEFNELVGAVDGDFTAAAPGGVTRTITGKLNDVRTLTDFGVVGDGVTDDTANFQKALDWASTPGSILYGLPGTYRITSGLTFRPTVNLVYASHLRAGLRLIGAGSGISVIQWEGEGDLLTLDTQDTFKFIFGFEITGWSVIGDGIGENGIKLARTWRGKMSDVHVLNLTGTGVRVSCTQGDLDGPLGILFDDCWIADCGRWGLDTAADSGFNELSFIELHRTRIERCGTSNDKVITGITQANPAVVTSVGHGRANGDTVILFDVGGMVSVNNCRFTVANATADTFELQGVNSTAFSAYTSGGIVSDYSGGWIHKGQIMQAINSCLVLNKNVGFFIPYESGSANCSTFRNFSWENNAGRHVAVGSCDSFVVDNFHLYSNDTTPSRYGMDFNAALGSIAKIDIKNGIIRATLGNNPHTAFKLTKPFARQLNDHRVRNLVAQNFGYTGQVMLDGFVDDPIPENCRLTSISATVCAFAPDFTTGGRTTAYRQSYGGSSGAHYDSGPWIPLSLDNTGLFLTNAGLSASTTYHVYLSDGGNIPVLEANTTVPVLDTASGYPVMTGNVRKRWIGRVRTNASTQFDLTSAGDTNWWKPEYVAGGWMWFDTDGKLRIKAATGAYTTLPTSDTDGTIVGTQT